MKNIKWILLVLITIISCNKKDEFDYPLVFTGDVINITDSSATFVARINNPGGLPIIESGFLWDIHPSYKNGFKIKNNINQEGIYELATNIKLLPGRKYYVRPYVQTGLTISYGKETTFWSHHKLIGLGEWKQVYDDNFDNGWCDHIKSSFTIDDVTYFAFDDGTLYSYSHANNMFNYVLSNSILSNTDVSLVFNGIVYIFSENTIYEFDPNSESFTTKGSIGDSLDGAAGFLIDDNLYFGLGGFHSDPYGYSNKIWKYNISTNTIIELATFPGGSRVNAFSFVLNNGVYIGGGSTFSGYYSDLWYYDPETDQWIEKEPLITNNGNILGANTDQHGYCFIDYNTSLFEYNPAFDIWLDMRILGYYFCSPYLFSRNNKLFLIDVSNYYNTKYFQMWSYEK